MVIGVELESENEWNIDSREESQIKLVKAGLIIEFKGRRNPWFQLLAGCRISPSQFVKTTKKIEFQFQNP